MAIYEAQGVNVRRVTIFGARGFVGGAVSQVLRARGLDVLEQPRDDIAAPAGGFGTILWSIGLTADFRSRPTATATAHVGLLAEVLAQGAHDRVVYLSSTRVYAGAAATDEEARLVIRPQEPNSLYNATKVAGESLVLSLDPSQNTVVRLSNVIGPREFTRPTFLGEISRQALSGQIKLEGAPWSSKDYIWIDDAARLTADIALDGSQRIYNVARGVQTPHSAWANALARETGCSLSVSDGVSDDSFSPISVLRVSEEFVRPTQDPLTRIRDVLGRF